MDVDDAKIREEAKAILEEIMARLLIPRRSR